MMLSFASMRVLNLWKKISNAMKKYKYQKWGFVYLADENGANVITGTKEEADEEFEIPCFNGFSFFKANNKRYIMNYPTIQSLSAEEKLIVEKYCGYKPSAGEYGVIAGALGKIKECGVELYNFYKYKYGRFEY